mmetsp:Transcript_108758/g.318189  ORF Transcript_108758/g.318189 Transcript_108758/m.318189 type:complete len:245 (-) Transcript_108758:117-851(-)
MAHDESGTDDREGAADLPPKPPEGTGERELLAWKRECNILRREAGWKRRQEELLAQKKAAWRIETLEREGRIHAAREARCAEDLEARVCRRHLELGERGKDELRSEKIAAKEKTWDTQESARLLAMSKQAKEEAAAHNAALATGKSHAWEELRSAAAERSEKQRGEAEVQRRREEKIRLREQQRRARAAEDARRLRTDPSAKSKAVVRAFVDRAQLDSDTVSVLSTRSVEPQFSHFGASTHDIL